MNRSRSKKYRKVLTIAGSDSGGGAGIQADLKTYAALGCYGMSVITAITAQNTSNINAVFPVPEKIIVKQLDAVLSDIGSDAVKIGMLFSSRVIEVVAQKIKQYEVDKIILDPVMVAQSGDHLLDKKAMETMRSHLMPLSTLITPNLPETETLLGRCVESLEEIKSAAKDIAGFGPTNVLIKGGHSLKHPGTDVLYRSRKNNYTVLKNNYIVTENTHGTGCTLSSAVAAYLAHGFNIKTAVRKAKIYLSRALETGSAYRIGKGHGPVHHFFDFWN
jgi:hydroxymethylpyrimidine/phosphomethylpyrimidine kinase